MASMLGISGTAPMSSCYVTSKFGNMGFSEALRAEMKYLGKNIKCTTICPWAVDTGMV